MHTGVRGAALWVLSARGNKEKIRKATIAVVLACRQRRNGRRARTHGRLLSPSRFPRRYGAAKDLLNRRRFPNLYRCFTIWDTITAALYRHHNSRGNDRPVLPQPPSQSCEILDPE